ncbi:MAG: hypothetical protein ACM3JG_16475 [Thiohalocapsa sp.]
MIVSEVEIDRLAREMMVQHGPQAARVAAERVNDMIDRNNVPGREMWACVVHRIHERQGTGPAHAGTLADWRTSGPLLTAV